MGIDISRDKIVNLRNRAFQKVPNNDSVGMDKLKVTKTTRYENLKINKSLTLKTGEMASIGPVCKMPNGQTYPKMNEFAYVQGPGTLRYPGDVIPDMSGEECRFKTYKGKETITLVNGLLKQLVSNN